MGSWFPQSGRWGVSHFMSHAFQAKRAPRQRLSFLCFGSSTATEALSPDIETALLARVPARFGGVSRIMAKRRGRPCGQDRRPLHSAHGNLCNRAWQGFEIRWPDGSSKPLTLDETDEAITAVLKCLEVRCCRDFSCRLSHGG